mmetsp:Transcript_37538/g.86670  ORF Transcript_37538/g.86670 Transcript_37538/m.86670 type:complete len:238 (+) Transcript_37538:217-930(+)
MARCTKARGWRVTRTDMVSGGRPMSSTMASGHTESRTVLVDRYGMTVACIRVTLSKACSMAMGGWSGRLSQGKRSMRASLPRTCDTAMVDMFGMMAEFTMERGAKASVMAKLSAQTVMAMSVGACGLMTDCYAGARRTLPLRPHPRTQESLVAVSAAASSTAPRTWPSLAAIGWALGSSTQTRVIGTSIQRICTCCLEAVSKVCSQTSCCQAPGMDQGVTRRQRGAQAPDPWGQPSR